MSKFEDWNEKLAKEDIWEFKTNPWQWQRFKDVVNLLPEANSVLEIGCMEGEFTKYLKNKDITAIDISSVAIERAKPKCPNVEFKVWDIEESSLYKEFDLVIVMETLYYLGLNDKTKENIAIMVKKGGYLVLEHVLGSTHDNRVIADFYHPPYINDERFEKILFFERYGEDKPQSYQIVVLRKK
jgi:2-polyprenyl-3-methyl-5-hydroxy-6-metoxy-1,4-benzoquinol methylase